MKKHWVIPDIHGCSKTLQSLIDYQINPSKHDWLYFLGDYIDRGPDSKGVIDYIMSLQEKEYNIRLLKGNHEEYILKAYYAEPEKKGFLGFGKKNEVKKEWTHFGGKECMNSFGVKNLRDIPEKYIHWLENLELYIDLDQFLLVHAGLNFGKEDPFEDEHAMLWIREFLNEPERIGNKTIIHGHVPINLELLYHFRDHPELKVIDLDNGVYMKDRSGFGNLLALELGSMDLAVQYNLDM
ncbi:MAG: serine/threonine protein phosphatase [Bacteroidetes bacterium]|nr:serine/threonine protein phosphatase [Bacteroidota bacterium]